MKIAVSNCQGASRVIDCEKKEGSFNKAFIIRMDNGAEVVARLPTRIAGPPKLTVCSEVATIEFGMPAIMEAEASSLYGIVKRRTSVPLPRILDWNVNPSNPVGVEYIIMSLVPGVSLRDKWNTMSGSQQIACIGSLGRLMRELSSLNFPAYGSLYFHKDQPENSVWWTRCSA